MPNITDDEYSALVEKCDFRSENKVSKLVTSSYTETKFNEMVLEKHIACDGAASYFNGFFGVEEWADGQGLDEVREFSTQSYLPISNEYFVKKMKPCIGAANDGECDWEECEVPEGGRGTLPGFTFYQWGLRTPRTCIANIRHIRQFWKWAGKMIENRERADQQILNMFYTMMAWKTAGHKVVMEYDRLANGQFAPKQAVDARNPFRGFSHNYMQEYFPDVENPENIGPLSVASLNNLARTWTQSCNNNNVATGSRGEKIWEFWFSDDWYMTEGLRDPDYIEKIRRTMPSKEFAGYSLNPQDREVIGNWATRTMEWLPRLAESTEGGLIPIDTHTGVDIEVGKEYLLSPDWQNAPFAVAMMPSPRQGTIMTKPDLRQSGDGIPILPITGSGEWVFRNDYDKECNKNLNKPFSQKRYEMGFRMDDPEAGLAVIHRLRKFHTQAENFCDLNPVIVVEPNEVCNDSVGIGCRGGKSLNQAAFTETNFSKIVNCSAEACGESGLYRVEIDREANQVDFNSLGCACGSDVVLEIGGEDGEVIRTETGTVVDNSQGYPKGIYYIRLAASLAEGECIKTIGCQDDTPTQGIVMTCNPADGGNVRYLLDSPIVVGVGDAVNIEHFDDEGASLASYVGTIVSSDTDTLNYVIASVEPGFDCEGPDSIADPEDIAQTVITIA